MHKLLFFSSVYKLFFKVPDPEVSKNLLGMFKLQYCDYNYYYLKRV